MFRKIYISYIVSLLNFARRDGLLSKFYRGYLHVKRFVLFHLGFNIVSSFSKDGRLIQCLVVAENPFADFSK